jgi:uncharacterized membrane protein
MNTHKTYRPSLTERTKWTLTVESIAGVIMCLFLFTGLDKLYNYKQFRDALSKSPVLTNVAGIVAWSLPVAEIFIATALFIPAMRKTGLKATILLLAVFTVYLSYMMAFAPKLPCMCAGLLESLSWKSHIIFNAVMIVLAIIGIVASGKSSSAGSRAPPT